MSEETKKEEKPDPYKRYKDFQWQNPDQFKNGPIDDNSRKCRDCVCCIIFILIFLLFIVVSVFGFWKGKPSQLLYFYDTKGNACGHDEGFEDYPYLYFTNVVNSLKDFDTDKILEGVCVKACPDDKYIAENLVTDSDSITLDCKPCEGGSCHLLKVNYYESKPLFKRICFPKSNDDISYDPTTQSTIKIYDPNTGDSFTKVVNNENIKTVNGKVYVLQDAING